MIVNESGKVRELSPEQQSCLQLLLDVIGSEHYVGLHRANSPDHRNGHMGVSVLAQSPEGLRKFYPNSLNLVIEAVCGDLNWDRLLPKKLSNFLSQRNVVLQSDVEVFCNLLENLRDFLLQVVAVLVNQREPENSAILSHLLALFTVVV